VDRVGLRRGERVLDVACGTGWWLTWLQNAWTGAGRVDGIDINAATLGVARSLQAGEAAGIGWVQGSVLGLPCADASLRPEDLESGCVRQALCCRTGPCRRWLLRQEFDDHR
jgi:ubiquinone/menaquinone biosynthesis C-methylase UbiE